VVHKSLVRSVVKNIVCSDRILALKLKAKPVSILIMQVYMPTSEYEGDEVEKLCDTIEEIFEENGKGDTNNIIRGDWNSVVGNELYWNTVGSHGLGRRNHRGQILIDLCENMDLWSPTHGSRSQKEDCTHGRRLRDWSRQQLDYILVKHRFRNSVKDVQTLPGADTDSDHNLVVAKVRTRLKKIIRSQKGRRRWDLEKYMIKDIECRIL